MQPLGPALPNWVPPPLPPRAALAGRWVTLEPIDIARHAAALFAAFGQIADGSSWTYLPYGPFADLAAFTAWLAPFENSADPRMFALVTPAGPVGMSGLHRIMPSAGSIEIGHVHFAPPLQRTPAATEAIYLLIRLSFELGYRRVEWKCDALNTASQRSALRLGFSFEGIFRQHLVIKGRNRDTAWFAMIDGEWPGKRAEFERWLAAENFGADGVQRSALRMAT